VADAEQILLRTLIFALGEMPPKRQVQAFNVLLDQPDALARFRQIWPRAEAGGQLYVLAALRMKEQSDARLFARALSGRQDEVVVYDSDVIDRHRVSDLVGLVMTRNVGAECRRLRASTEEYFRELAKSSLQPTRGADVVPTSNSVWTELLIRARRLPASAAGEDGAERHDGGVEG
jgi:hypothetical protein